MTDSHTQLTPTDHWADGAVVYQIYPRSFQDSNGDGIGDLPGITARLDYLKQLGINAIWLSPFYPSPMADFGYDVADYCNVDPMFGTLQDFDDLLRACGERDIKLIIDLVPNHSSDEHPWFQASRKDKTNDYADWYIWRDAASIGKDSKPVPPNNWLNIFSGTSAWEWVEERQQFYLHSFHTKQPDLNWSNPEVRGAIKDAMRFWLDRGVDGFRVDAVYFMAKEPSLTDNPINPHYHEGKDSAYNSLLHVNSQAHPTVYEYLGEMADVLKEPAYEGKKRFMVTEAYPGGPDHVADYMKFYDGMDPEVAAPFNFEGLSLPWEVEPWRKFLAPFHKALADFSPLCVASYAFGNHDQWRLVSRLGEKAARAAAVFQLTLPGMIFIYNGEEIGMHNVDIPADKLHDPAASDGGGRDPERTPMQWSAEPNAGFSTHEPWLPVAEDYQTHNVETERADKTSFLNLYKHLTNLRATEAAIRTGEFELVDVTTPHVLAFRRSSPGQNSFLTFINFSDKPVSVKSPLPLAELIVSSNTATEASTTNTDITLAPNEALVYRLAE